MTSGEEKKEKSLQSDIIPLATVPDKWRLVNHLLETEKGNNEGPVHAFHAAFLALKNLWYAHEDEMWKNLRVTIALGLIKDTKKHGNTSVSMGAAKNKFEEHKDEEMIGFLNCGTGGIKYQLYSSSGCLHLKDEYKPKNGASPNALEAGKFKPKEPVSFDVTRDLFAEELAHKDLPWAGKENVIVYAFVTGTIREHWERADAAEKAMMEEKMRELFEPHKIRPQGESYFMPQDEEGTLELLGAQQMYANLVDAGQLDPGTKVVGSLGIGKGSCQWMVQEVDGTMALVGHKFGMTNIVKLAELTNTLAEAYQDSVKREKFRQSLAAAGKGVIALKSGAAILIDSKDFTAIKAELVAQIAYPERTVRVTLGGGQVDPHSADGRVLTHTWRGSLDRLCAEVQVHFQTRLELEVIFRETEGKFEELARDGHVKEHELLYFTPRGVRPVAVVIPVEPPQEPIPIPGTKPKPRDGPGLLSLGWLNDKASYCSLL